MFTESRQSNSGLQRVYIDCLVSKDLHRVYTESTQSLYRVYTEQYAVDADSTESTRDNNGKKIEKVNFSGL